MPVSSAHLLKQAIRLVRANFDMRCAAASAGLLADRHDDHGPLAYGLLTGMVVSYARPFTESYAYGQLESKWSRFPGRPDFKKHHRLLMEYRKKLLAHNDVSQHRATVIWSADAFHHDRPAVVEARSPIDAKGIREVLELFDYQASRFREGVEPVLEQLQSQLRWPRAREIELEHELERLGTENRKQ